MSSVLIKLFACYLISLGLTPAYDNSIDDFITEINGNVGFIIIGWYKYSDINDRNNNENTDNRRNWFHFVSISPTNKIYHYTI